jgi:D-lactate dehydrogenase (cytochrome)
MSHPPPANAECIELVDADFMAATNLHGASARVYDVADHLFVKMQGPSAPALAETAGIVRAVAEAHGGSHWMLAGDGDEADSMWTDRKNAHYAGLAWGGEGCRGWSTDVW